MTSILEIVYTVIGVVGLWWIVFFAYPQMMVARLRYHMFVLRDEMFDYAASGGIDFNHKSYGMMRIMMNGFIRMGHKVSIGNLIAHRLMVGNLLDRDADKFGKTLQSAMADLPPDARAAMEGFIVRMHQIVLAHLVRASVFSFALVIILALIYRAKSGLQQHWLPSLDKEAYMCGAPAH